MAVGKVVVCGQSDLSAVIIHACADRPTLVAITIFIDSMFVGVIGAVVTIAAGGGVTGF